MRWEKKRKKHNSLTHSHGARDSKYRRILTKNYWLSWNEKTRQRKASAHTHHCLRIVAAKRKCDEENERKKIRLGKNRMYLLLLLLVVFFPLSSSIRVFSAFSLSLALSISVDVSFAPLGSLRAHSFFHISFVRCLLSLLCSAPSLTPSLIPPIGESFFFSVCSVYPHPTFECKMHTLHVCIRKKKSSSSISSSGHTHTKHTYGGSIPNTKRNTQPNSYIKPTCSYSRTAYILHTHTRRSLTHSRLSQRNRNKTWRREKNIQRRRNMNTQWEWRRKTSRSSLNGDDGGGGGGNGGSNSSSS